MKTEKPQYTAALIAACMALGCAATFAQDASTTKIDESRKAAAMQLMETMEVKKSLEPAMEGIKQMQDAMIAQQPDLTDEQREAAKELMKATQEELADILAWENMSKMFVDVYAEVFTDAELKQLTAMFESDAGQVYVNKQAALQMATMQKMQGLMADLMPKIQAAQKEALEKIQNAQ